MNTAIWFSFQLTENSSNWLLQLDLHLIWWKISWNWILQLDLHLIWRKIRIIECWNFMFLSINRKFVKLNTATWSAIDLTENFVKLNTATWFASDVTKISSNWILQLDLHLIWRKNSWKCVNTSRKNIFPAFFVCFHVIFSIWPFGRIISTGIGRIYGIWSYTKL